jgi:small-conductance mechanosensitive channel
MDTAEQLFKHAFEQFLLFVQSPAQWWQVIVLLLATFVAGLISKSVRRQIAERVSDTPDSTRKSLAAIADRIALPTVLGVTCLIAAGILQWQSLPQGILSMVAVLALALVAIQLSAEALKRVVTPGPMLATFEHVISWTIWFIVALHLLGWIDPVAAALDRIALPVGKSRFSLLDSLRVFVTLVLFSLLAAYLGSLASKRIMAIGNISIGLRVGIAKTIRVILFGLAAVLALDAVGVNLGALTVFGGALGIGLGFGLQRIAANFVSGFVIIADRSIRQGDVITIGDRFGVVRELRARYIVVQDRDGVDTLIPNEQVFNSEVVNWSYADRSIRLKLPVQISYQDNPRQALQILLDAAAKHPRVQEEPRPASRIMAFGDNGIDLELRFWIRDPEDGVNNVRSDLYLEIWDRFEAAGITIPYPQRDLHLRSGWPRPVSDHPPQ